MGYRHRQVSHAEVDHVLEVLPVAEAPGSVLDDAYLGIESFKYGIGSLGIEVVEYLDSIADQALCSPCELLYARIVHVCDKVLVMPAGCLPVLGVLVYRLQP